MATSIGVEATARSASDCGYNVSFAVDARADLSADAHRHSAEKVFPKIGEVGVTADVMKLMERA